MASSGTRSLTLGFLHVRRSGAGLFRGGYLLTTDFGRPIEFHYTSELSIPRSQQLLYGASFEPHLYAEILAKPLTDRQSVPPQLIVVDVPALLELRRLIPAPVVIVRAESDGHWIATPHAEHPKDAAIFEKVRTLVSAGFDWREPIERVASALAEIQDPRVSLAA